MLIKIVGELITTISILSKRSDLICIVNSFRDTLIDEELLAEIRDWNTSNLPES